MISRMLNGYQAGHYTNLTASDCLNAYTVDLLTDRRNLIVVSTPTSNMNMSRCGYLERKWNGSSVFAIEPDVEPGIDWITNSMTVLERDWSINYSRQQLDVNGTWFIGSGYQTVPSYYPVRYCLSETNGVSNCQLQFVSYILYVVVVCNLVKVICMSFFAYDLWNLNEPVLATVGDATASFLDQPDETTAGWCLLDLQNLAAWTTKETERKRITIYERAPRTRLYHATSKTRWWWTMILCTLCLILGFVLFSLSFQLGSGDVAEDMKVKFGAVNGGMVLGLEGESGRGLIIDILVANSFQLALSTTYFLYNSLYTAQWGALEWASLIRGKRKALRVTLPRGQQRSTYYLQLPYRYGIPLTLLLVLMHFLISQSIFLARLQYYYSFGGISGDSFSDVGFSPSATITTCSIGFAMIMAQILHALRPLDNRIPIHGNSSAVISAMCHARTKNDDSKKLRRDSSAASEQEVTETTISTKPITWGVTEQPDENVGPWARSSDEIDAAAGHCSFSADMVELPQKGRRYR